jgi:hypothetical protein
MLLFGYFSENIVSVCFGLLRNSSVCFGCFDIGSKHRNKPKFLVFGFTKQTETNAKQILFRFVSVRTEIYFCLFRGHPCLKVKDGDRSWRGIPPPPAPHPTDHIVHRVDRCQAFSPVVRIRSAYPVTCRRVLPPPLVPGGAHTRLR